MRKIDRLFEIVQLLRGQRLRTAEFIADKLGVSVRTVYRDIQGLAASGVPIEGERGVGYIIRQPIEMPPLHFTPLELQAIQLGVSMVQATSDTELAAAAREAAIKIADVLPARNREPARTSSAHVYFEIPDKHRALLAELRRAIEERLRMSLAYVNERGHESDRVVRPLGLEYWGKVWTLTAWCELRDAFRVFRIDRIRGSAVTTSRFRNERGKTYKDYLARAVADAAS